MASESKLSAALRMLKEPRRSDLELGTTRGDLQHILFRCTNMLFLFVIAGFAVKYTHQQPTVTFSINLLAVFPSSILMGVGLKSMRERYGGLIQALLYMTFGYVEGLQISEMLWVVQGLINTGTL
jgi:Ca2+:H+ antiporter